MIKFTFSKTIYVSFLLLIFSHPAFSQTRDRDDDTKTSTTKPTQQSISTISSVVMDGPVDPKEYIVGPGDVFNVSIWSAVPLNFQVPVTPEGTVIIPTVNEISVSGLTLEETKKLALNQIRRKYLSGQVSFTLLNPRSFYVTVKGNVMNEGPVIVRATQRAETAIELANNPKIYEAQAQYYDRDRLQDYYRGINRYLFSKRNIIVLRKNGSQFNVDLEKFNATQNTVYNPLLQDGDVIVVPARKHERDVVGVYGAVNKSGDVEFVEGDSLLSMLKIAGGLMTLADSERIVIYRSSEQKTISADLKKIVSGLERDFLIQRGDRIVVYERQFQEKGGKVSIEGEVFNQGSFAIFRDSTKLSDIIALAGGFTQYASLHASRIIRIPQNDRMTDNDLIELSKGVFSSEDTSYFRNELHLKKIRDVIQTDFVSLFEKNDRSKDIYLQNGDKIIIPSKLNSIYVFGEVKNPGYVSFNKGKDISFYLSLAGGETDQSESADIKIVKAGTKQWLSPSETSIEEGDYVWVPKEPYRTTSYYLNIYSQIFGIVGTIATLILLVTR